MATVVVIMIIGMMMAVLHAVGDCDAGDGSNGDTVVIQKERGDGYGSNGEGDVHGQGAHVGHDGGGGDDSIVALCPGGGGKGEKSRPLGPELKKKVGVIFIFYIFIA